MIPVNPLDDFSDRLFKFLTNSDGSRVGSIIKRHSEKLDGGEFSFPWSVDPWKRHIVLPENDSLLENIFQIPFPNVDRANVDEYYDKLVVNTSDWPIKILKCILKDHRVNIFIDRTSSVLLCFRNFPIFDFKDVQDLEDNNITLDSGSIEDITYYRLKMCHDIIKRVFSYTTHYGKCDNQTVHNIHFSHKTKNKQGCNCVLVAPVLNKNKTKETEITSTDYLRKRTSDMEQIALHKYGLRVIDKERWKESISNIGKATIIFDLLENKPTHSVSINTTGFVFGSSKGAAFVMYNYARLRNILKTFNDNMKNNLYPALPSIENVDLSHLKDEDEWILIFNFILPHRDAIEKCIENRSNISPHHLCIFLSMLATRFSVYYRRIRILLTSRQHLIPLVHARIHLLMKLQDIFDLFFYLLNINPVIQM